MQNADRPREPRDIPRGFRALSGAPARTMAHIQTRLTRLFDQWGYEPLYPPTLEFEDVVVRGLNSSSFPETYRIIDTLSGRVLLLRPDFTPSIARACATAGLEEHPQRIWYAGPVFRAIDKHAGHRSETRQAGVEIIGCQDPVADIEVLELCLSAIGELCSDQLYLVLGHGRFVSGVLEALELAPQHRERAIQALHRKDHRQLHQVLEESQTRYANKEVLLQLPGLIGSADILDRAQDLVRNQTSLKAIQDLRNLHRDLELPGNINLVFDLSDMAHHQYYTGCCFEVLMREQRGQRLATGGRYDNLIAQYASSASAAGFGLDLDALCDILGNSSQPDSRDNTCIQDSDSLRAYRRASELRAQGERATWMPAPRTDNTSSSSHNKE